MLIFQNEIMEKIRAHAQLEYPRECCGILFGKRMGERRIAYRAVQTRNMVDERQSRTHFYINPLEIVKAEALAEQENLEIVGFYHSHPDYEPEVSGEDLSHMIAGYSYPIISVRNKECIAVNSYVKEKQTDLNAEEEKIQIKES